MRKLTKKKFKASIIIGILNVERTISDCLEGIFMQNYPRNNYEVVIIDGGSTDATLDIIEEFMKKEKNMRLLHNPNKLSEGKGMSKDMGVSVARGEIVIFLDGDNILTDENWLGEILFPFEDREIMASQSLLKYRATDNNFLKYINYVGVEDPFAIPYSLVAQVSLYPWKFQLVDDRYYRYEMDKENDLFGGANGCAFRKEVFLSTGGYTRDVDVFACMAEKKMKVAVPKRARLYHQTSNNFLNFLKKKGVYFYRFINNDYQGKKFNWIKRGMRGKIQFWLMLVYNLSIIGPAAYAIRKSLSEKKYFLLLHPLYLFFITLEYSCISLLKIKNFLAYSQNRN